MHRARPHRTRGCHARPLPDLRRRRASAEEAADRPIRHAYPCRPRLRPTGWEARQCWVGEKGQQSGAGASLSQNGIRHIGRHPGPGGHSTYQPTSQTSTSPLPCAFDVNIYTTSRGGGAGPTQPPFGVGGGGTSPPMALHYQILIFEWQWIPEICIVFVLSTLPCSTVLQVACISDPRPGSCSLLVTDRRCLISTQNARRCRLRLPSLLRAAPGLWEPK